MLTIQKKVNIFLSCCLAILFINAYASSNSDLGRMGLKFSGNKRIPIYLNNGKIKVVSLMQVDLSKAFRDQLSHNIGQILNEPMKLPSKLMGLPSKKDLGMNHVPVLDQGQWSSCVTFAVTEAVDALYNLEGLNRVSQLCNLQVKRSITPRVLPAPGGKGGWNGAVNDVVFQQISKFGYLNMAYQYISGCGNKRRYPLLNPGPFKPIPGVPMPVDLFQASSCRQFTVNDWVAILVHVPTKPLIPASPEVAVQALERTKLAISEGFRVTMATLLTGPHMGAVGKYHGLAYDAWVLTPEIKEDIAKGTTGVGAHDMVIYGYNDTLCATYKDINNHTQKQCGLLFLRNSIGKHAGDHGNYYMTYDYFKGMLLEAYIVGRDARAQQAMFQVND